MLQGRHSIKHSQAFSAKATNCPIVPVARLNCEEM